MKLVSFRTLRSMCLDLIIFLIPLSLIIVALPHILGLLAPFAIGVLLYFAANPLNRTLKTRSIPPAVSALISLFVITLLAAVIIRFAGEKLLSELYALTENPPKLYTDALSGVTHRIDALSGRLRIGSSGVFKSILPGIYSAISEEVAKLIKVVSTFLLNFAKGIPSLFIASVAAVFTAFFLLRDSEQLLAFSKKFFGEKFCRGCIGLKDTFLSVTVSYLKAQFILFLITFAILLSGFMLLKVRYALLLAILTALVDAVPLFGTGTILIPAALFNFLSGNTPLGWGFMALYGISFLARQFAEPKILGKSLGIHPLLTVFSLYVGMKLFGVPGLILGPFFAIFAKILIFS